MKRWISGLLIVILILTTVGWTNQPPEQQSVQVPGLKEPAEILVDKWGVPHIYAKSQEDAFYVQGFNAARDRLWQIDLWRKRGLGKLSEVLGPSYVEQDRAARLFLYQGDMEKEWEAYGPDTKKIVTAFVNGINAYVEKTEKNPELLPEEFKKLGYRPEKWKPEDVVRIRSHGLSRNVKSELARARTLAQYGEETEQIRQRLEPEWDIQKPKGIDYSDLPEDVLQVYDLATQGVSFEQTQDKIKDKDLAGEIHLLSKMGSNNWTVSGERTETGRPILANDPHRSLSLPSLRYIVHLSAPGMDVIGGGEPILPGVSIGHNEKIAFGLTIFAMDQEDLYVYKTRPQDPTKYWYKGKWVSMEKRSEKIPVKGEGEKKVTLRYTKHGPVIYLDEKKNKAYAVRAAWLEPGMAPYLGSISYMRASNWEEFSQAMSKWGAPSENQVYADTEGNIGWKPGGLTPVRENWDGLLPVPGDGRYEWSGFLDSDKLPREYNPERGYIGTANEMNLPEGYPYEKYKLGFEWATPFRFNRVHEVLRQDSEVSVSDSLKLQTDYRSEPATRMKPLLDRLKPRNEQQRKALQLLKGWDAELSTDSAAAALFEVWYQKHVRPALVDRLVPDGAKELVGFGDPVVLLELLEHPDQRLGEHPEQVRDHILLSSLDSAIEELEGKLGSEWSQWKWGDLHHAQMKHSLSKRLTEAERKQWNTGRLPRGGGDDTVGDTNYDLDSFAQTSGATYRMVIDVGAWDQSIAMNSPGQSGDVRDPHYRDLFSMWAKDEAFPLLYSREKVEAATEKRIRLVPRQ